MRGVSRHMEITFRLDDDDYRDFVKHARARVDANGDIRSKLAPFAWAFWISPALTVIATRYFWVENPGASLGHWYAALGFTVCWIATWYWYLRRYSDLQTTHFNSPDGYFKQEQRLGVTEAGVSVTRATSFLTFKWSAIKTLDHSERQFFLHLDTAQALCVPKRVFSSHEEADAFAAMVKANVVPSG